MNKHLDVVYVTDEDYAMPTCISMLSLVQNIAVDTKLTIHVVAINVSDEHKSIWYKTIKNNASLHIIEQHEKSLGTEFISYPTVSSKVPETALFKFIIPQLLENVDKCLYIDGDTIVNKDISDILDYDISSVYVAAIDDMGDEYDEHQKSMLSKRINIDDNHYFNSGVMFLNLKKMRNDSIFKKLFEYRINEKNFFMDQDAFNIVLHNNVLYLPIKFNFRTPILETKTFADINRQYFDNKFACISDMIDAQIVLHLTDRFKPWKYNTPWFTDIFLHYYRATPYKYRALSLDIAAPIVRNEHIEFLATQHNCIMNLREKCKKMEWRFPREKIPAGSSVVIYGAGDVGSSFVKQMAETHYCRVVLWVDKRYEALGNAVHAPGEICGCVFDYAVIAAADENIVAEISSELSTLGIGKEKIICL